MFLKNKNILFKTKRSKVTDYAALNGMLVLINDDLSCIYFTVRNMKEKHAFVQSSD